MSGLGINKACVPKTTTESKTITLYYMPTFGSNKCMHMVHSGGFGYMYLR